MINNIQQQNLSMNPKAKRYFQEMNKENIFFKPLKSDKSKEFKKINPKIVSSSSKHQLIKSKPENRKHNRDSRENVKLPKIFPKENKQFKILKQNREHLVSQLSHPSPQKKYSNSVKKLVTQPSMQDLDHSYTKTLSPVQNNMKQIIRRIMKNKENRHLISIDEEIDKLDCLAKRYSFLRKDLVAIQEDILTLNFKQKFNQRKVSSQFESVLL